MIHLPDISTAEKFKLYLKLMDFEETYQVQKTLNLNHMIKEEYYPNVKDSEGFKYCILAYDSEMNAFLICLDHEAFPDIFWLYPEDYENESWILLG